MVPAAVLRALAPSGVLRAGVNLSNFLLVSSTSPDGGPRGVSPDLAAALAGKLGVPFQLVTYTNPGFLADAAIKNEWDVALLGAEPQRAAVISFTKSYAEIEATYLVPPGSPITAIEQVDAAQNTIVAANRAAYCLWLENNIKHAALVQPELPGVPLSRVLFEREKCDVLAGLRPWLLDQCATMPGSKVLAGRFTSIQQALGTPKANGDDGVDFLEDFVQEAKASGLVQSLIDKHGVTGRLTVAA
ncbi:hypothetical protein M885DRAFT_510063 [Pelagophyceae sp. CCMP2097]|nr:hypothetical protein M885DRAFT_510063 [Pelagophyceae sp. CCMP2097]